MLDIFAAGAEAAGPPGWTSFVPLIAIAAVFWFLILRPQMKQQKQHREKVAGVKKGDQIVTAGGIMGKVVKVEDQYADVEIAQGVKVKVIKATIGDIVPPGGTAAND